jgi:hypothetical protein
VTVANPSRQARPSFSGHLYVSFREEKENMMGRRRKRHDTLTLITAYFLVVVTVSRASRTAVLPILSYTVYIRVYTVRIHEIKH